ncbi:transporter substrate-binding domain-containing protein [Vibrio sp. JC009]|uniref:transporter substrate-binding domain-containing protein n=1 Tax=Vibrio sp. JC009 TaxID=2912314 RepID=UPI0023AE78F3|nr:transporter substrate-binding domain-containing protein [Vibrio sp. JC009]WED23875.1 transporter substrate-binding domain-containing protein [Vibrio sp. JC009]
MMNNSKNKITFWNGNKSIARQAHEFKLLEAVLQASCDTYGDFTLQSDLMDYPDAEDEGNIFYKGADILVTVAENSKFHGKEFIEIGTPLAKGILGNRILIIRQEMQESFKSIKEAELKTLKAGIPATWADADLFRHNGYKVVEKGLFEEIFQRLKAGECDYVSLGANEVETIFDTMASAIGGLAIESDLMLYYPFPLVFYVHPLKPELAERVEKGLKEITASGEFDSLFEQYYGTCVRSLALENRRKIVLENPQLPRV